MSSYLVQASYSVEALAAMMKNPQDRTEHIRKTVEKIGGKLTGLWLSFGDYDIMVVIEMPDHAGAAAFAIAIGAGGACRSVKTTPLLGVDEGIAAMKKAGASGYKAVSAKK
ncbi:MAG: GYD domain-containing protein [Acidobacteriota bacterium]|nr:GYD domain-containing protein [Acidobacteriota bacterium]